jgi:hypothetical protein
MAGAEHKLGDSSKSEWFGVTNPLALESNGWHRLAVRQPAFCAARFR